MYSEPVKTGEGGAHPTYTQTSHQINLIRVVFDLIFYFANLTTDLKRIIHAQIWEKVWQAKKTFNWSTYVQNFGLLAFKLSKICSIIFSGGHFVLGGHFLYTVNGSGRSRSTCMQNFVCLAQKLTELWALTRKMFPPFPPPLILSIIELCAPCQLKTVNCGWYYR